MTYTVTTFGEEKDVLRVGIQEFQVFSDGSFYIRQTWVILTNKSDGILYIVPLDF